MKEQLSELSRAILEIERRFFTRPGSKEQAIAVELGLTSTRYHQLLNQLIDTEAALAADPVTVRRLQRLRAARHQQRAG